MENGCLGQQLFIYVVIAHLVSGPALRHKNTSQSGGSTSRGTGSNDGRNEKEKPPTAKRRRMQFDSSTDDESETSEKSSVLPLKRSPRLAVKLSDIAEAVAHSLRTDRRG